MLLSTNQVGELERSRHRTVFFKIFLQGEFMLPRELFEKSFKGEAYIAWSL